MSETFVEFQSHGLRFSRRPTWEETETQFSSIEAMGRGVHWWIGDLLLEAQRHFGEQYAQLIPPTMARKATECMRVCSRIPQRERFESLDFSHHAEVSNLRPEQRSLVLRQAEIDSWTVQQVRDRKRELLGKRSKPKLIACPQCGHKFEKGKVA